MAAETSCKHHSVIMFFAEYVNVLLNGSLSTYPAAKRLNHSYSRYLCRVLTGISQIISIYWTTNGCRQDRSNDVQ